MLSSDVPDEEGFLKSFWGKEKMLEGIFCFCHNVGSPTFLEISHIIRMPFNLLLDNASKLHEFKFLSMDRDFTHVIRCFKVKKFCVKNLIKLKDTLQINSIKRKTQT